ncbi:alpha/beta fold hydrolase [Streptomyces sp. NPDC059070]|uniref:alpha/beta fold hydrolase n=1 Tax=unclassified Streptomyces TaxID=2593676 RepID=UPI0034E2D87F
MVMIRANGLGLHVQRLRPPRQQPHATVVFVHGAFIDSLASYYFTLGPRFAEAGFDAVMYDLRGHGRSERPPSGYALDQFTADLDALLDGLGITDPVHLVGNSFGGTVALDFVVHRPERVASVTVVESGPASRSWSDTMTSALRQAGTMDDDEALLWFTQQYGTLSSTRTGDARHDAHIRRLGRAAARLVRSTTIAEDMPTGRVLTDAQLGAVRCPVLLVNGQEGLVAAESARLSALLPHCRVAVVPGQKHSVLVEASGAVGRLALDWVREHAAVPGAAGPPSGPRGAGPVR